MVLFIYGVYIDVRKKRKRKGMFLLVKFIVHMRSSLYLVFFLQALLVPFPVVHFRILFLLLLTRAHMYSAFTFIYWYLFLHSLPKALPFLELFVHPNPHNFIFFFLPKSFFCFFSTREPASEKYRNNEQN